MGIKNKFRIILITFFISFIFIVAAFLFTLAIADKIAQQRRWVDSVVQKTTAFEVLLFEFELDNSERALRQLETVGGELNRLIDSFEATSLVEQQLIERIKRDTGKLSITIKELEKKEKGSEYRNVLSRNLFMQLNNTIELAFKLNNLIGKKASSYWRRGVLFLIIVIFSVTALVTLIIYLVNKNIALSIASLKSFASNLAEGELEYSIIYKAGDEFAEVYELLNRMSGALRTSYEELNEEIKERKVISEGLKEAERFLDDIIESMPSAIIVIDDKMEIARYNRLTKVMFGLKPGDIVGQNIFSAISAFEEYKEVVKSVFLKMEGVNLHKKRFVSDKKKIYDIALYPLQGLEETLLVIRVDDITTTDKIEQQLVQAQKMDTIGLLAGGLAHDLNNVLAGIITTISLIKFDMGEGSCFREFEEEINIIESAGKRATGVVQQLLTLSRKSSLSFSNVDLKQSLQNVVKICRNSFNKDVVIELELPEEKAVISADMTQIEQALLNIMVNGAHAMTIMRAEGEKSGGILSVKLGQMYSDENFCINHSEAVVGRHYYILRVDDSGVGMDSETQQKIFEPFYTTKGRESGTGLGLSVVYNIIKQHEGFIELYSKPGIGTSFNIFLPVGKDEELELKKRDTPLSYRGSGKLLVIDDEEMILKLAASVLQRCGFTPLIANGGEEGIKVFKEQTDSIKAVILDMSMPKMSGKEVYIKLKEIEPGVKVLVSSGFENDDRVKEVFALGGNLFLHKPYNFNEMVEKLRELLPEGD